MCVVFVENLCENCVDMFGVIFKIKFFFDLGG